MAAMTTRTVPLPAMAAMAGLCAFGFVWHSIRAVTRLSSADAGMAILGATGTYLWARELQEAGRPARGSNTFVAPAWLPLALSGDLAVRTHTPVEQCGSRPQ